MVQRGQPILVVNDPRDVWVLTNVKETYIATCMAAAPCLDLPGRCDSVRINQTSTGLPTCTSRI